ncbi:MAG: hypothetical protein R8M45_05520, partial [Ghiorsea sp.]
DKGEIQFAEKVLKAAGVADVNGSARHAAGIFKALSAQSVDTKKAWASALQSAKDGMRTKKGFIYDSETFNASLEEQNDSAAKAKAFIDEKMGVVPVKETPKKPKPVAAQNGLPTKQAAQSPNNGLTTNAAKAPAQKDPPAQKRDNRRKGSVHKRSPAPKGWEYSGLGNLVESDHKQVSRRNSRKLTAEDKRKAAERKPAPVGYEYNIFGNLVKKTEKKTGAYKAGAL